ncbi:hypothetical protein B4135_3487 [Caldibacillus debilis]|uniref:Uncharacterized protein n=1 Tax=Caldibacillus debilis TaxID=301148 RepID=A0A150LF03_9BACI|nr:hypothetical protein B4135_3487 [Caldibacillus debilis]
MSPDHAEKSCVSTYFGKKREIPFFCNLQIKKALSRTSGKGQVNSTAPELGGRKSRKGEAAGFPGLFGALLCKT